MSLGPTNVQCCVNKLEAARGRCDPDSALTTVIEAVTHLAEYCRKRVADHPALYPYQLEASISNLCARIEALESSAEALANPATENPANRHEWDHLLETIGSDCNGHGWTDIDALVAWRMGRAAMLQARLYGARFSHDTGTPPYRAGQLEGMLDLLLIGAESAARRLRDIGETDYADSLSERCERARVVLAKGPPS